MIEIVWYLGSLIVLVLLAVAIYLHWRLHQISKQTKRRKAEVEHQYQLARQKLNQSIQIICRALIDGQVDCAEASVRISALMDQLSVQSPVRDDFVAFDKFAQAIAHIPILDAWQQLPKQQKRDYERQIQQHEEHLGDFIRDAAQRLIGKTL